MLTDRFLAHIKAAQLWQADAHLLLAVSGGVDSVVLTDLCRRSGYRFAIAHCNFQLREAESERDELFVKLLAEKYQVPFFLRRFDTTRYAEEKKISIQEAARELRYDFFHELLSGPDHSQDILLTAHHRDDNTETLLMNLFRGTGLAGLTGIPPVNGKIRRPLLPFSREEIREYAEQEGLQWVEDSSNASSKYTRNFLRNEWIPAIEKIYPDLKANLARSIERFREIHEQYTSGLELQRKRLLQRKGQEWRIPIRALLKLNRSMVYELLSSFGFSEGQLNEISKLARAGSGKYVVSASRENRIIVHRKWFLIAPVLSTHETGYFIVEEGTGQHSYPGGVLHFETLKGGVVSGEPMVATLDAQQVHFPLVLRKARPGDYFYPLGMRKKKKIARFLIDQRASKTEKENCWLIESGGRISWVIGQRPDERFKINGSTRSTLRISLIRTE